MVSGADRKDAQPVERRADCDSVPRDPGPECPGQAECTSTNGVADGHMMSACSSAVRFGLLTGRTRRRGSGMQTDAQGGEFIRWARCIRATGLQVVACSLTMGLEPSQVALLQFGP